MAGVLTQDLVETIGSGSFRASYVNWSRTLNLLRQNAPGWMPDTVPAEDGSLVHRAPVGGYLLIRFVHADGTETPCVPQAVMDTRNNAIPFEKITARDITDTQRRGACLAACFHFGLAFELWAKMPVESGYPESSQAPVAMQQDVSAESVVAQAAKSSKKATKEPTEADFLKTATKKGLCDQASKKLLGMIKGNFAMGIKTLESKDGSWVAEQNAPFVNATSAENW